MDADVDFCPMCEAMQLLQEKWMLHIIRALLEGPRGFNELSRSSGGCNPATLAQRLDQLEGLGLVSKTVLSVMPPRTIYDLTPAGRDLRAVIDAIHQWGQGHRANLPRTVQLHGK
ncbi:MAG TPA: helix-turn-helix domain-containing protein [Chloroflexia bacterium]|nr:helix-turn-helix domain-containing protein [Chloroflexia bacterium]